MSTQEFDELDEMIEQTDLSLEAEFDPDLVPEEGFTEKPAKKGSSKKSSRSNKPVLAEEDEKIESVDEVYWYVVHCYSGYENKVKANLEKTIANRHLEEEILEVRIPMQDVAEYKNGSRKMVQKKMFPGYVMVNMILNDDTWFIVRNTRGVTGFVGPDGKAVPLTEDEMRPYGVRPKNIEMDYKVGDTVMVVEGAWEGTTGMVQAVNPSKETVTINVELFGRETPVEITFLEIKKL